MENIKRVASMFTATLGMDLIWDSGIILTITGEDGSIVLQEKKINPFSDFWGEIVFENENYDVNLLTEYNSSNDEDGYELRIFETIIDSEKNEISTNHNNFDLIDLKIV